MLEYKTIEGEYFTEWEINKSRFLTYIKHVETEIEAQEFISSIKKMITVRASRCYNLFHGKHDTWRASTP